MAQEGDDDSATALGVNLKGISALVVTLAPLVAIVLWVNSLKDVANDAKRDALDARKEASEAKVEAVSAKELARTKGDEAATTLNGVNVKLARMEVLLEQLVKESAETKAALKTIPKPGG